jgi:putative NADH-flavin reductase
MNTRKLVISTIGAVTLALGATACSSEADTASDNVSKAADNFQVNRRITVINGITDKYLLVITGACSINTDDPKKLVTTCKTGPGEYKKFYAGLSDNVTWTVEQGSSVKVSGYHYKVIFRPSTLIPDIDFKGSSDEAK